MKTLKKRQAQYQIILIKNNECVEVKSSYTYLDSALLKFNSLLEESKKVTFPIQYYNEEKIEGVKFYLAIIKRKTDLDGETSLLKNDYGEYVEHIISDNDEWIMYQKEPFYIEESFWVYGFHPRYYRKDFNFIFNNIVKKYAHDKYDFLNVFLYKNKVLFESTFHTDMVICKNQNDAVRLYALLDDFCQEHKMKYIMFSGAHNKSRKEISNTIEKIIKLTGWSRKKVRRNTT